MENNIKDLGFELIHIGVNCEDAEDAKRTAELFARAFGFGLREGKASYFAGNCIECMRGSGKGRNGHIAIGTVDVDRAAAWLESQGFELDASSRTQDPDGRTRAIYLKDEIAGFAVHLLMK